MSKSLWRQGVGKIGRKQSNDMEKRLEDSMCLTDEVKHQYEFVKAENGASTWRCRFCGFLYHEYEDSQP